MSILPLIALASVVSRMPACPASGVLSTAPQCYAPITVPAIAGYAVAASAGVVLLGIGLRRLYRSPRPSA